MALRLTSIYKSTIVIDGEIIPIHIKRLDPKQSIAFNRDFARMGRAHPKAPENETEEAMAQRIAKAEEDEQAAKEFVASAIGSYITVEAGNIYEDEKPESVTKGADLVRLFGARDDVLGELLMQIFMENKLNAEQKSHWKTRLAPFVPTPTAVADRMMELAGVGPADTLVDLGCGDGQLCIAAAKRGAKAFGYDIDADRVQEATAAADAAGVSHLCSFEHKDALTVDVSKASVVSLYLLAGANSKLRPVLLQQLPDGARVVSHAFLMGGDWIADASEFVPLGDGEEVVHSGQRWVYLYSVDRYRKARAPKVA